MFAGLEKILEILSCEPGYEPQKLIERSEIMDKIENPRVQGIAKHAEKVVNDL